ncbi:MAG TPA: cytochrome P450 [Verrucomicrobiae bacterium]|nr:cytochrome P450 [Verrucomicrobiae bacterium]
MDVERGRIPAGPQEEYSATDDLLEWMRRQFEIFGDIYKASVYGTSTYAIRDVEFGYRVLVENWQNYVKGQDIGRVALLLGTGLVTSEGELWKRQRRMIQPSFNHESIAAATKIITSVNSALLRKWQLAAQKNESVNITRDISAMALEIILRFLFGDDYDRVGSHFDLLTQEKARDMALARSFRQLGKIVLQVMEQRRKGSAPSADALGMFMQARDPQTGQFMEDRQLVDEILTMVVAGHETSASTLSWAWYLISQHPEVERKLSNEINHAVFSKFEDPPNLPYTRQIVEEVMRLYPSVWLMSRRALRDDQLGEFFVPAGTEIYIPPYFIQRNPKIWEEPDRFNPDRFQPEKSKLRHRLAVIPFGAGPRTCIGSHFARVEMQIHLITIARHLRLRFVPSTPIGLDAGVNLRSKDDFIMYPQAKKAGNSELAALDLGS